MTPLPILASIAGESGRPAWRLLVLHGSEVEIGVFNTVTIRHPKSATVKLRRMLPGCKFVLSPITSQGQWLELRR
jgi:hypothetical protein